MPVTLTLPRKPRKTSTRKPAAPRQATLTAEQGRGVQLLLEAPIDFVDSPSFHDSHAEHTILGAGRQIQHPNTSWYAAIGYEPRDSMYATRSLPVPLLTPSQEQDAFHAFNYCRFRAEQVRLQLLELAELDPNLGQQLLSWDNQIKYWRDLLTGYNLGLVVAMTRRLPSSVDLSEMISEGNMALLRAIDKFNVGRGFKFSTYACRAIIKAFSRAGRKVERRRSLTPCAFDPTLERSDWDERRRDEHEKDCVSTVKEILESNTAGLSALEIEVLQYRFNLDQEFAGKGVTLKEVGKQVGLTKERVRQVQIGALKKFRRVLEPQL